MHPVRLLVVCAVLVAASSASAPAAPTAKPPPCGTVTSGMVLLADCTGPMRISTSGVHVVLGSQTVTCNGNAARTGIVLTRARDVHIVGGTVTGCGTGILINGGGGNHLVGVAVDGNLGHGIDLESSNDNLILGGSASSNTRLGVLMNASSRNVVKGTTVNGNNGPLTVGGIFLTTGSNGNMIEGVSLDADGEWGIRIDGNANKVMGSVVTNTFTSGSAQDGIIVIGSNNSLLGNTTDRNLNGIAVRCGVRNVLQGNRAGDNEQFGIVVYDHNVPTQFFCAPNSFPTKNKISGSMAFGNGWRDLGDYHLECKSNTWFGNMYATKDPNCIS